MVNFKEERTKDQLAMHNVRDAYKDFDVNMRRSISDAQAKPYTICLLNITGDLNVGSIIRTASLLKCQRVIIMGRREYDKRSTVGAQHYVDLVQIPALNDDLTINIETFFDTMAQYNLSTILVEHGGTPLNDIDWPKNLSEDIHPCFVFGNEGRGIDEKLLDAVQHRCPDGQSPIISIPQFGILRSYNVANAAAIVMYDLCRGMRWLDESM